MDGGDRRRLRQAEQIAVAAQVARMVAEAFAAEVRFAEPIRLEHRPHRAVEDEDPVAQEARQGGEARSSIERAGPSIAAGRWRDDRRRHGIARAAAVVAADAVAAPVATPVGAAGCRARIRRTSSAHCS